MIYMPGLIQYLSDIGKSDRLSLNDTDQNPEEIKLWLPSDVPTDYRPSVCMEGLPSMEDRLHTAQCHDALQGIHHTL